MSPEERQLLQGLFDRMRNAASNPRDREAEALIADNLRQQPYAPYLLSQTVIVQDQALRAANDKLQQLEAQLQQAQGSGGGAQQSGGGGFLSGIGSLFGGGSGGQQPPQPSRSPWNQGGPQGGPGYAPQQGGPWGGGQPQQAGGGGFLHGALGAAAGVAGGVLLADSIKGLFGGHNNGLGIASGMGGMGGMGGGFGGGDTVVNNYYGSDDGGAGGTSADWQQDADQDQDDAQDAGDYSTDV